MRYLFEDYALDPDRRELRLREELVLLEPQVFDLLAYLVQNRDRVVTQDDILGSVWEGRTVTDSTLRSRINAARAAIGDNGDEQRLIRTLRGKGFRFVGEVRDEIAPGKAAAPTPPVKEAALGRSRVTRIAIMVSAAFGALALVLLWRGGAPIRVPAVPSASSFDAALVPIITDAMRQQLARYRNETDNKALAISVSNYGFISGASSTENAKQEAIERCRLRSQGFAASCRLYAIGMDVVWDKALLPMPAPEDISTEPLDLVASAEVMPFTNAQVKKAWTQLADLRDHRAFVLGRIAHVIEHEAGSRAAAVRVALERCVYMSQEPCMPLSVDGFLTTQIPKSRRTIEIFLPRTSPDLSPQEQQRVGLAYQHSQGKEWRALARGKNGWHPVVGAESEIAAVDASLNACMSADTECRIFAIGNFKVAGK